MNYWLLKTDPETYSFADLEQEKQTVWDGVRSNAALLYIRQMRKGDLALIYHSGGDKCIMGIAEVTRSAYADPQEGDEKLAVVDLKVKQRLPKPVPLSAVKADRRFAQFSLVRISRLSVMPVEKDLWSELIRMGIA